jgi:hypothetical protein
VTELASSAATFGSTQLVPASYAEKAMASIMQLHTELMDEKERRVDLFRKLMEREQALAELKMYMKVLEEELARSRAQGPTAAVVARPAEQAPTPQPVSAPPARKVEHRAPVVPNPASRRTPEGWKSW